MAILNKDEARAILEKVLKLSKADGCDVNLNGSVGGNLRFARNSVSTSGAIEQMNLGVASNFGKKQGIATINEFDDKSLEKVVRRSEELAQLAPENPEFVDILGPQTYADTPGYYDATASISPDVRTEAARSAIEPSIGKDLTSAGYYENTTAFQAKLNSKGLFAYYQSTNVNYALTARTNSRCTSAIACSSPIGRRSANSSVSA